METTSSSQTEKVPKRKDWREERRFRVLELHAKGFKQAVIAHVVGLTQGRISQILKCVRDLGPAALRKKKACGAPPKLNTEQRTQLLSLLLQGAQAFGFSGELWTSDRVAQLILQEFGICYHPHHIPKLLRACGWSPQKPIVRAAQRDEKQIREWFENRWPEIKKKPKPKTTPFCL